MTRGNRTGSQLTEIAVWYIPWWKLRFRRAFLPMNIRGNLMIDGLGRDITYMRISVTELCNLRCRYCMPADGICKKSHFDMLTEDEMITAVEAAASLGITKLRITGGEPLVKKNIISICRRAAEVEGIREVCLTTNGVLLPEFAGPLKNAGIKRLNISLDTLDSEKYA